jgi:hypothetical protein
LAALESSVCFRAASLFFQSPTSLSKQNNAYPGKEGPRIASKLPVQTAPAEAPVNAQPAPQPADPGVSTRYSPRGKDVGAVG